MGKIRFTYVISPKSYHGYIEIYEGELKYDSKNLYFTTKRKELLKFLKKNPDSAGAIIAWDITEESIKEGERLSKKLNLQFMHP